VYFILVASLLGLDTEEVNLAITLKAFQWHWYSFALDVRALEHAYRVGATATTPGTIPVAQALLSYFLKTDSR